MAKRASPSSSKILVTNRAALVGKYGVPGLRRIEQAVAALAAADEKRGFATRLCYLDHGKTSWPRVSCPSDPRENKRAVDGVYDAHEPAYLVILGSWDVVPYQDLRNPVYDDPDGDDDRLAPSDLPYACDAPYSTSVNKFLGPTRVVGRIPDLTGATSPGYLLGLLRRATKARPSEPPREGFILSARVWKGSTVLSARRLLGASARVSISPRQGPRHPRAALARRLHLVNCHGNEMDPMFVGEWPEDVYSDAMHSSELGGLRSGTVAAFECCYGAELYDPNEIDPALRSIAFSYLARGAHGVLASTNTAYGMPDDVSQADVLCVSFLEHLQRGASLGRALLEARLAYLEGLSVADAFDKKTLAQFVLLGDPSIHPFTAALSGLAAPAEACFAARSERRRRLRKTGSWLGDSMAYTVPDTKPDSRSRKLAAAARRTVGKSFGNLRFLRVQEPVRGRQAGKSRKRTPSAVRAVIGVRRVSRKHARVRRLEALLAYEVDGQIKTQILVSR